MQCQVATAQDPDCSPALQQLIPLDAAAANVRKHQPIAVAAQDVVLNLSVGFAIGISTDDDPRPSAVAHRVATHHDRCGRLYVDAGFLAVAHGGVHDRDVAAADTRLWRRSHLDAGVDGTANGEAVDQDVVLAEHDEARGLVDLVRGRKDNHRTGRIPGQRAGPIGDERHRLSRQAATPRSDVAFVILTRAHDSAVARVQE